MVAEQCLHRAKDFSASKAMPVKGWGCTRSWDGAEPNAFHTTRYHGRQWDNIYYDYTFQVVISLKKKKKKEVLVVKLFM